MQVIEVSGGTPPVTFPKFNVVVNAMGDPPRPLDSINLENVNFGKIPWRKQIGIWFYLGILESGVVSINNQKYKIKLF